MKYPLFFKPRFVNKSDETLGIAKDIEIFSNDDSFIPKHAERILNKAKHTGDVICSRLYLHLEIPSEVKERINKSSDVSILFGDETYVIELNKESHIWGNTRNAIIYGLSAIEQYIDTEELNVMTICDYPESSFRGYRVFTPGYDEIVEFKRVIDMMVYYKYNTIMIEVGGAMEYKRHPAINNCWVQFCNHVRQKSGNSHKIQSMYPWRKNSIHSDNGGGSYITQEDMKELIRYCQERGLMVIPEVPSLSHSDYIVMAYPEINERKEDEYPDTYCPSNPLSYKILFDILDEVINVFEPKAINIGHDEVYTLAQCDKCKNNSPIDLFVNDITKIYNYLKSKGISTMMWCEKLFNAKLNGYPVGGAASVDGYVPALYTCASKLPKDITMINWYWSICDESYDEIVHKNGYRMIVGNFNALQMGEYRKRFKMGIDGGFASNWGSFKHEYMQRNHQYLSIVANAYAFWNNEYDTPAADTVLLLVAQELFRRNFETITKGNFIRITHTTNYRKEYKYFYDGIFIERDDDYLGHYLVKYSDGSITNLPVIYGLNISNKDIKPVNSDMLYLEVLGASLPKNIGNNLYFETVFENPNPDKEIHEILFMQDAGKSFELDRV